ncbi:resuscitation-promoting factor [Propionicimonas sp.]|uniref:resuscitation-promoting factor n=1 Tax=Propionicimonas sp. TaxID=1955623 RepID=UPI001D625B96|nr:resuscitation-promoting factor [Propionicimonas sp.]MBU3976942.1 transglycosylase family protein [Actinomycetota bacterium]MBU3986687.1 transglycosylase family protein [Actinomycetota bacterium]MBU4007161.1 transglycosylase family protein [Actinomycetota bacterium]MBU4064914.1 transglycosylase family protein [Actinomycetota bacterium]MBU4094426.1 transglycosylase family protein [Actinomycetota bacterium]
MKKIITAVALGVALAAGGTTTATALHKDVQLTIDGQPVVGGAFAVTVADVLNGAGVVLGPNDLISPALDAKVEDGHAISVTYAKPLTLIVDGQRETLTTTARTLDEVLGAKAIPELAAAWISVPLNTELPRTGLEVQVSTPKKISLSVAGAEPKKFTTTANTVADLLNQQGLSADADDVVSPEPQAFLAEDAKVRLDRVEITTKTLTEDVDYPVTKKKNSAMWAGESKTLVAGKDGRATRTYEITTVNGKVDKKKILNEIVLIPPTPATLEVGTKTSANGVGINLARAAMWDRIAKCESGGNWHINTGNGYYGGLQFSAASWRAMGGRDFAALPHQASRAQQITVANRYYDRAGLGPWGCSHAA